MPAMTNGSGDRPRLHTVTDAGMLIGPLVMGPLADAVGLGAPFVLAAILLGALAGACRLQVRAAGHGDWRRSA